MTITDPTNLYLNAINFNQTTTTAGYILSGGTINLGGSGTPTISVTTAGVTETISAVLAGSSGLTFAGAGTLVLNGVNTYTGITTIGAGTLQIGSAGQQQVPAPMPIILSIAGRSYTPPAPLKRCLASLAAPAL